MTINTDLKLSDFCKTDDPLTVQTASDIVEYHYLYVARLRVDIPDVIVTRKSCYRPKRYELQRGRSGKSQHTFNYKHDDGVGAIDLTCSDITVLLERLIFDGHYRTIAYYPNKHFIHADFREWGDERGHLRGAYFIDNSDGEGWQYQKWL